MREEEGKKREKKIERVPGRKECPCRFRGLLLRYCKHNLVHYCILEKIHNVIAHLQKVTKNKIKIKQLREVRRRGKRKETWALNDKLM